MDLADIARKYRPRTAGGIPIDEVTTDELRQFAKRIKPSREGIDTATRNELIAFIELAAIVVKSVYTVNG